VLGQVLAVAAHTDFASLLAERILAPVGMGSSNVATRTTTAPRGWSSVGRRARPWAMGGYAPAGGIVSTLTDMTTLVTALLDGRAPGGAALSAICPFGSASSGRKIGMFWMIDASPGTDRTMVWHNGRTGGYSAFVALYPQARRAVIVMTNVARPTEPQGIADGLTQWLVRPAL
jgi:CubicO group peptidase (beta-lactamase class C family)